MYGQLEPGWMACPRCGARVAGRCPACVVEAEGALLPEMRGWDLAVWLVFAASLVVMAWRVQ